MVRRFAQLPRVAATHARDFGLMAETLRFETNDPRLLDAAAVSFGRFDVPDDGRPPLLLRLFVEPDRAAMPVAFRTHGSVLLITGGPDDVGSVDVAAGIALGFVADSTAADEPAVRRDFIESMGLVMVTGGRGYVVVHAAGVVIGGRGVTLYGAAGAGKSTLAMACARRGLGVFAEDAVFCRTGPAGLELWGMPWTQRLLPDAAERFPELRGHEPALQPNGELKLQIDMDAVYPGRAVPMAAAGPVVVLQRGSGGPTRIVPVPASEAEQLVEVLWAIEQAWTEDHERAAASLLAGGVYRLEVNGTPDEAVDALEAAFGERGAGTAVPAPKAGRVSGR